MVNPQLLKVAKRVHLDTLQPGLPRHVRLHAPVCLLLPKLYTGYDDTVQLVICQPATCMTSSGTIRGSDGLPGMHWTQQ